MVRTTLALPKGTFDGLGIDISSYHHDGRLNSIDDEDTLISKLESTCGLDVKRVKERHWYDVLVQGSPVQIKSSTGRTDNWSSKKALLYCLTDMDIEEIDAHSNKACEIQKSLCGSRRVESGQPIKRDLDVLVVEKTNGGKVHHTRLCEMSSLTSNGSNLPFQINWKKNVFDKHPPIYRTQDEAYGFIMSAYIESIEKKQKMDNLALMKAALSKDA
jgi:hypothetical protein